MTGREKNNKEKLIINFVNDFEEITSKQDYLNKVSKKIKTKFRQQFIDKYKNKDIKCCYCETDIRIIQKLIKNRIIEPRKCNTGFRGIHLETEHLDGDNTNDNEKNISFCCYFCNNDKSNNISPKIFKNYFGVKRGEAFTELYSKKFKRNSELKYYFYKKSKKST